MNLFMPTELRIRLIQSTSVPDVLEMLALGSEMRKASFTHARHAELVSASMNTGVAGFGARSRAIGANGS